MPRHIQMQAAPDGTLTYLVAHTPAELPAVRGHDLIEAWHAAREAARHRAWGEARAFRFVDHDGNPTDIALRDADARCWASAVDRTAGLTTLYGMSLCLRLLALVDLLASARWAARLVDIDSEGAAVDPALLRLAAAARLNQDARFDEAGFRARLANLCLPARPHRSPSEFLA
jgi:hypothetical protein